VLVLAALAMLASGVAAAADETRPIAVVVGRESFVATVSEDALRDLYLRRQRLWPGGERAIPINLPPGHPVRERFSERILGRSSRELVAYWNGKYFEGIMPPAVLPSPAAIRAYLAAEPGAIAYLPADEVDATCRPLLWLE
jgi:hypothetical protein